MPIRLTSPPRSLDLDLVKSRSNRRRLHDFSASSTAGRILICTILAGVVTLLYCWTTLWAAPQSWFFNADSAYEYRYTDHRLLESGAFIKAANASEHTTPARVSKNQPVMCVAMTTIKRKKTQYLSDAAGSMLVGLTPEERSAIEARLIFVDLNATLHPQWDDPWLDVFDWWGGYNVTDAEMDMLREYRAHEKIQAKGIFDYAYALSQCYNETTAPYIAMVEDDVAFADGWLAKTLDALATVRQKKAPWLYLRLFFTEWHLGWDADIDSLATNPWIWFVVPIISSLVTAAGLKFRCHYYRSSHDINHARCASLWILLCVTIPAIFTLLFLIRPDGFVPRTGVVRMDDKGCCTQALVYPREQVPALIQHLHDVKPGPTDLKIEKYANELGLARYALAPQVVQHIGLISTRGMPKKYTQQTWAFTFETQKAEKLAKEHAESARWGVWRAELNSDIHLLPLLDLAQALRKNMAPTTENVPAKGIPFWTPQHLLNPGTPLKPDAKLPTLFTPLTIRGNVLRNRIIVAPMCQYSTAPSGPDIGALTPYHITTLGHYALKGAGLVFIEASGVQPNGRISPNCPGIWSDDQIPGVKAVADMVRSQGALCGMQLAHAGRKSSTVPPFIAAQFKKGSVRATKENYGWPEDVVSASGGEDFVWDGKRSDDPEGGYYAPRALSKDEIKQLVQDWAAAAVRSVKAGVDVIEIHGAHGYLIHQFLSPITNQRTDDYGGSFENRTRLLVEIIKAIRAVIPESMPLFLRLSSTEWMDDTEPGKRNGSWDVDSTIRVSKIASDLGVDLLDVSSGGNHPQQKINMFDSKDYQTKIAAQIRRELREAGKPMLIGAVGLITEAEQARDIVSTSAEAEGQDSKHDGSTGEEAAAAEKMTDAKGGKTPMADCILVARQFMREPEWVLKVGWKLGVDLAWPNQFNRVRFPKL
ncbi:NADH-dependent flavin oxidoreductase [Saxophila tyrrhenica]|uniref:NADH-dependent flavin oxidoreductase n=1 Tax=Saxophila tyrrhenica TaxID=1690608 RepID=A0AAV9PLS6_9PEZI|nr:NADH-dependent flavin oxidoreductase [Saxophila tyrrhenica]